MRETVRSLRAYFILSGIAGLFWAASALRFTLQGPTTIGVIMNVISIVFGLGFVYVGVRLPLLLRNSANRVVSLLYASAAWTVVVFLLSLAGGVLLFAVVMFIITMLILWYLLKNVRRLAADAKVPPAAAAPTATNAP